jgi:ribonuclease HI
VYRVRACSTRDRLHTELPKLVNNSTVVTIYFDGLCEPRNPGGYACGGWYVPPVPGAPGLGEGIRGHRFYFKGSGATNNQGEYRAALDALLAVWNLGYHGRVLLRGDSQLVIYQVTGKWGCKAPALKPLLADLRASLARFEAPEVEWVPRDQNAAADEESRRAYDEAISTERR